MKINKTASVLAIALSLATGAQAANTVYITGSTAFRAQVYYALEDLGLSVSPSTATTGANTFTFTGTEATALPSPSNHVALATGGDTSVTVNCAFTGSSEGLNSLGNQVSPTYNGGATYVNGADLGFCDVQEASTTYPNVTVKEIVSGDGRASSFGAGMAIVPFTFAASADANGKIGNVTPYIVNDAYLNSTEPLSFFTGNSGDANTTVYAIGRTNDSGTRISALLDVGFDTDDAIGQWALGTNGDCAGIGTNPGTIAGTYQFIGNDGYESGGNVAKALNVAGTGDAISYLGWPDADSLAGGALPITYEGANPTTVTPITTSSWVHGTNSTGTDLWNINGVANGSYTYWSYEHLFESTKVGSGSFADNFGKDLVNVVEFEILHPDQHAQIQTALTIGQMNVNRGGGDGTDVLPGN